MNIQRERAHDIVAEITPLLQQHYAEISADKDIPLDPDIELYCRMEDSDALRCYTARVDGQLIGYAIFILRSNPHYRSSKQAVQDVLYVRQDRRGARAGIALIRFSEDHLRADGVQVVYHHVKVKHPALGRLLLHEGYDIREHQFAKRLDLVPVKAQRAAALEEA